MTDQDIARISANGHAAAAAIAANGPKAYRLAAMLSDVESLQATQYDRSRSVKRDEMGELIPNDPTGETAIARQSPRSERNRLEAALDAFHGAAGVVTDLIWRIMRDAPGQLAPAPVVGDADEWCESCARDGGYREPIARHPDGRPKYLRRCRWCRSFEAEHRRPVPLQLLKMHHEGRRIYDRDIQGAIGGK